jgi:outer membrane protein assembly factor BamB
MKRLLLLMGLAVSGWALVTSFDLATAEERTWRDASGQYSVDAEFQGLAEGQVSLRKTTGEVIQIPLKKLSEADRRWVARNRRKSVAATPSGAQLVSKDWPRWRGPNGDGISSETGLLDTWEDDGPPIAWSSSGLGKGYSSIAIHDGKIFTMGKKSGAVTLICVSAQNGSPIWETALGSGKDPNCTPTVDPESGLVFGLTIEGQLVCLSCDDGKEIWRKDYASDFGGEMMSMWGYSESPLVDGDRLICTPGSSRGVMAALDKKSGKVLWTTSMAGGKAGYASPVISHGGGVKQYVTLMGKGLIGVRASDGQMLWNYPRIANNTANVPTPIIHGDLVFGSSGYGDGGSALLRLSSAGRNQVRFSEVYYKSNNEVQNHHGGMIRIGDHVYMGHGHNNGFPLCMHLPTGRVEWAPGRGAGSGSAAVVAADGHLYFRYEDAVMALIEASPKGYKLKGRFRIKSRNGKSWAHPVVLDGKLFLRDNDELHCYDISG